LFCVEIAKIPCCSSTWILTHIALPICPQPPKQTNKQTLPCALDALLRAPHHMYNNSHQGQDYNASQYGYPQGQDYSVPYGQQQQQQQDPQAYQYANNNIAYNPAGINYPTSTHNATNTYVPNAYATNSYSTNTNAYATNTYATNNAYTYNQGQQFNNFSPNYNNFNNYNPTVPTMGPTMPPTMPPMNPQSTNLNPMMNQAMMNLANRGMMNHSALLNAALVITQNPVLNAMKFNQNFNQNINPMSNVPFTPNVVPFNNQVPHPLLPVGNVVAEKQEPPVISLLISLSL
jgi:hypothetical protein